MQVLTDDGTSIHVRVEGPRTADPLVLIHGFPFDHELWNEQIESLAQDHFIIRPDLRGMGSSQVSEGPYLMELLAADIATVLDKLSIDRVTIAGHSLGGYVALAFARMFTERVGKLALVSSRLSADTPQQVENRRILADRLERENAMEPLTGEFLTRLFAPQTLRESSGAIEFARELVQKSTPRGAAAMLRGAALRTASDDIAADIEAPVLVIAGGCDAVVPLEESTGMAAVFPRAELVLCERSGHLPMLEEPQAVTSSLRRFLEG
jgi:3-oxoadipate enol-lactonase